MINQSSIDNILQATDIVRVLEKANIKLRKQGRIWKGCCPFHDEKTHSFVVYENTQTYKCFGCGEGGNVFSFLMKHKNMTFVEAAKELAKDYHIEIEQQELTPEVARYEKEKESLRIVYEAACTYFHNRLLDNIEHSSYGQYALSRFDIETIKNWKIGYADEDWQSLWKYLREKGFSEEILTRSDLFREGKGRIYDFFRGRLMFPIFDRLGRVVAFSGRDLTGSKEAAKYQNSSETSLYIKGHILFGLNFAIPSIRKYDVVIIVEGNADVIKLHQLGINNVVAACGTALTVEQIMMLGKYTKNFCLLYDSDSAGEKATVKNGELILSEKYNSLVLSIPPDENGEKQDPDTFFKSRDHFKDFYIRNAIPYIITIAKRKADKCENNATYAAETAVEISKLFLPRPESERAALIDQLAKIIKPRSVWTKALKELEDKKKEHAILLEENGRTNEQNKSLECYGFYVDHNSYYFIHQKNGNMYFKGSNFIMEPLFHIESTVNAKRLYKLTNEYGISRVLEFPQKDMISIAAFKLKCESVGNFRFDAGEYGLAKIKAQLYEKTKTCKELTQLGWQKQGFWAWSNGIFNKEQFEAVSDEGICTYEKENFYIPALSSFYRSEELLFQFERKFKHIPGAISPGEYFEKFFKVYGENAIVGIGFYLASLFRDVIVNYSRFFPILNLFGPKGTGKSEMALSMLKLFGDLPVGINMTNSTVAAMADHISHTRNAICHIDEYKNSVDYEKIEFLKGLWDGTGRNRMNMDKDKKKEMTAVDSAILLTGQEMATADIALFSRVIFLSFTKMKFTDAEKTRYSELKQIEKEGLTQITNEVLKYRALFVSSFLDNFNSAADEISMIIDKNFIEDRIFRNWIVVLASLRTLKDVIKLPIDYKQMLRIFAPLIERQNSETKANNEISNFWDIFSFMVREGTIEKGYDYRLDVLPKIKTDKFEIQTTMNVLQVDLCRITELYSKHGNNTRQKLLPKPTLKYYLENATEYLGKKKVRLKKRSNQLQNRESVKEFAGDGTEPKIEQFSSLVHCFDYSKMDIDIQTSFVSEEEEQEDPEKDTGDFQII